jgi:hypothetical protein
MKGGIYPFTEGVLKHAYNVDVTWLDPSKDRIPVFSASVKVEYCEVTSTSHQWPHEFYLATITQAPPETKGFGFPLSKEGGNWDVATSKYRERDNAPYPLGTPDAPCLPSLYQSTPSVLNPALDFSKSPLIQSTSGNKEIMGKGLRLFTGSPTWVAAAVQITNSVNFVSFKTRFTSAGGAEGLLSVYWDTNILSSIDERAVLPGMREYTFPLPETATNGIRMLGFRLDAFSTTQSSVTITNVTLGFRGLREPFTLTVTNAGVGKLPALQLNGPAGFNYTVETSTNLTDWSTIALLVNTNGTVRFTDPTLTNATARFYRAVVH